jgi:hypothetical protein
MVLEQETAVTALVHCQLLFQISIVMTVMTLSVGINIALITLIYHRGSAGQKKIQINT